MNERLDEPDGPDYEVVAEQAPDCDFCGEPGAIYDCWCETAILCCLNPNCPGNNPDDGPHTWRIEGED